jgi:hypothetical protein
MLHPLVKAMEKALRDRGLLNCNKAPDSVLKMVEKTVKTIK